MKKTLTILVLIIFSFACIEGGGDSDSSTGQSALTSSESGSDSSVTITSIDTSSTSSVRDDYSESSFSRYILFHKTDKSKMLLDYNFFPSGYDLCQTATYNADTNPNGCRTDKTVEISCEYQSLSTVEDNDYLSISLNAPTKETECENQIVIDLSAAEFTADGLVFSISSPLDIFASDFEFNVTSEGFTDARDGSGLTFDSTEVGLEEVYNKIIEIRTS